MPSIQRSWLIHYLKNGEANTEHPKPKARYFLIVLALTRTSPLPSTFVTFCAAQGSENATPWEQLHWTPIIWRPALAHTTYQVKYFDRKTRWYDTYCQLPGSTRSFLPFLTKPLVSCFRHSIWLSPAPSSTHLPSRGVFYSRLFCGPVWALTGSLWHRFSSSKNFERCLHPGISPRTYLVAYKLAALMQDARIRQQT